MANIFQSSIGKKLIMSISGLFLVVFLLVHMILNLTAVFSADAFNTVCDFMGTNPIVQIMVPVLAFGVAIHIIYAFIISIKNLVMKGKYEVASKAQASSWASKNMFVLGLIILCGLGIHLFNFWSKMQLMEYTGGPVSNGYELVSTLFMNPWYCLIYLVWFAALWYHLSHGFWSAFHTLGWNNKVWFKRWQVISIIYATLVCGGFAILPIYFQLSRLLAAC